MKIQLTQPLDMHLHLRDGDMLRLAAPHSQVFSGAVVMPNLTPPITNKDLMQAYVQRIAEAMNHTPFTPLMTVFLQPFNEAQLNVLHDCPEFFAMKLYPSGITTNSEGGLNDIAEASHTLRAMEERGIPLLIHGESHGYVMDREAEFLPVYRKLATDYPKLRICMEHITTAAALDLLNEHENLSATLTLHHMLYSLDDLAGGLLNPHLFCKPIVKRPEDRDALLAAALKGHSRLMFGSDSAPHPQSNKESAAALGGCYAAPVLLPKLAEIFAAHGALPKLQAFVSDNACAFYGIEPVEKMVELCDTAMQVPANYQAFGQTVVPLCAGESIGWSIC